MQVEGFDISSVGGKAIFMGKGEDLILTFGWIPKETNPIIEALIPEAKQIQPGKKVKKFKLDGSWRDTREKSNNCEIAKKVCEAYQFGDLLQIIQITGSCVGASGGHVWFHGTCNEIALGEFWEDLTIPFWLLPYGKSREECGLPYEGEGSLVETFAKVIARDGILDARDESLPKFTETDDGIKWGSKEELKWSSGARIDPKWLEKSKEHKAGSVAQIQSVEDAVAALDNGYAIHHGSSWGGSMTPTVVSNPPVLLNRYKQVWMHAMMTADYWFHPVLGLIFWVRNTWGRKVHGTCPSGMPKGGFWVLASEWERIILKKGGECYVYSNQKGFPVRYKKLSKIETIERKVS